MSADDISEILEISVEDAEPILARARKLAGAPEPAVEAVAPEIETGDEASPLVSND